MVSSSGELMDNRDDVACRGCGVALSWGHRCRHCRDRLLLQALLLCALAFFVVLVMTA